MLFYEVNIYLWIDLIQRLYLCIIIGMIYQIWIIQSLVIAELSVWKYDINSGHCITYYEVLFVTMCFIKVMLCGYMGVGPVILFAYVWIMIMHKIWLFNKYGTVKLIEVFQHYQRNLGKSDSFKGSSLLPVTILR